MKARAMVFAAGFGTRMGALTRDCPKPLLTVSGRTLLDHTLDHLRAADLSPFMVNAHYRADDIARHLATVADATLSREEVILDTGGGLKAAPRQLAETAVTANADAVFAPGAIPAAGLLDMLVPEFDAVLVLTPRERAIGHAGPGDFFVDAEGRPTRRGAAGTAPFVFTGLQAIRLAPVLEERSDVFSLNRVWDRLIAEGRLKAAIHDGDWVDTGTPSGLALAEALVGTAP